MSTNSGVLIKESAGIINSAQTLVDVLRWRAQTQPGDTAYTFLINDVAEESRLTYGELDRRARRVGARLQELGAAGERVLLLYPPGLDYIAAFLGCLYAGAVAVPAYPPRFNQHLLRLQAIVADARAKFALTTTQILSRMESFFPEAEDLRALGWVATDGTDDAADDAWQNPCMTSEGLAFLQYTSGSTSAPKGVMVSHGNLIANSAYINNIFSHTDDSISVTWLPAFHDMGLIDGILQPLYSGFPCYLMSPMTFLQRPLRWLQAISHYRATHSGGPNFAYELCVRKTTPQQRETLDLSSWDVAYNGAETVRKETLERFYEAFAPCGFKWKSLYPCYGLAEATLKVTGGGRGSGPVFCTVEAAPLENSRIVEADAPTPSVTRTLVGCGRAPFGTDLAIVNPDTLMLSAGDEVGEIWVANESVAQGYWNREEQTEQNFRAYIAESGEGPFLRTGDLGFMRDGELFVAGRLKDLIIIGGRNHYPQDIEQTVEQSHAALRAGCIAACSFNGDGEEQLLVVAEVNHRLLRAAADTSDSSGDVEQSSPIDFQPVIRAIRRAVSEQHDVQVSAVALIKIGSIPKTSSGKIQRHACRAGFSNGTLDLLAQPE